MPYRYIFSILLIFNSVFSAAKQTPISYKTKIKIAENLPSNTAIIHALDSLAITIDLEKHPDTLALIYHKIGVFYNKSNSDKAIKYTQKALKIRKKLHEQNQLGADGLGPLSFSLSNLGVFYKKKYQVNYRSIFKDSLSYYFQEIIELGEDISNKKLPSAWLELGLQAINTGDYEKGIFYFDKGLKYLNQFDEKTNRQQKGFALLTLEKTSAITHQKKVNLYPICIPKIQIAIAIFEKQNKWKDAALAYRELALLYAGTAKIKATIETYEKVIMINTQLEAFHRVAYNWNNFGYFYNEQKEYKKALVCFEKSLKIKETLHGKMPHPEKGAYFVNTGETKYLQGNYEQALGLYHNAIQNYIPAFSDHPTNDLPTKKQLELCTKKVALLEALEWKAKTQKALLQPQAALKTLILADQLTDLMRKDHTEAGSRLFWREKTRNLYESGLALAYETQNVAQAFYFFEKSKSILLLNALIASNARQLIPDSLAAKEQALLQHMQELRTALLSDKTKQAAYLKASYDLDVFLKELKTQFPNYYKTRYAVPITPLNEDKFLKKGIDYIHFFYGEAHFYAMQFGNGTPRFIRQKRDKKTDETIQFFLQQFQASNIIVNDFSTFEEQAYQVYQLLLAPLFQDQKIPKQLVILPDDFLSVLPFEALKTAPSHSSDHYLLMQSNIRQAYSIAILKTQQTTDNQPINVLALAPFADKTSTNRLPNSHLELTTIQQIAQGNYWFGQTASKAKFLEEAAQFPFLHLSTHAHEKGDWGEPQIDFANNENLLLAELYATSFPNDLIILSACETGLGAIKKGEGILSLNRGFTYAGAKSMISSLWKVNDASAASILGDFYQNLNKNMTKSAALQQAKIAYLQQAEPHLKSPYYWAGFTYSGADRIVELNRPTAYSKYYINYIIGVAFLGAFLLLLYKKAL